MRNIFVYGNTLLSKEEGQFNTDDVVIYEDNDIYYLEIENYMYFNYKSETIKYLQTVSKMILSDLKLDIDYITANIDKYSGDNVAIGKVVICGRDMFYIDMDRQEFNSLENCYIWLHNAVTNLLDLKVNKNKINYKGVLKNE